MHLFDTHAHLTDARFVDDLPLVLSRAKAAGVSNIVIPSSNILDAQSALNMAANFTTDELALYCSVGVHPHDASTFDEAGMDKLRDWMQDRISNRIVALGEIGLDYHYDISPKSVQQNVFIFQLDLAIEFRCPVIIHSRKATEDMLRILREYSSAGRLPLDPGVFHCFSGSAQTAVELMNMGFYFGFDGPITFKNSRHAIEVIENVPEDKLLVETDCPYLTPEPFRGKRNEPAYIRLIVEKMAEIKGKSFEEMAEILNMNAKKLFLIEKFQKGSR